MLDSLKPFSNGQENEVIVERSLARLGGSRVEVEIDAATRRFEGHGGGQPLIRDITERKLAAPAPGRVAFQAAIV